MSDYLDQLALRVQQPEFAVQPRPVSRFESPRQVTLVAPEPLTPGEADEPGSPSAVFIADEIGVDRPAQHTDNRKRNAAETVDSLSIAGPAQESQTPYPGHPTTERHSTTEPPIVTPPISTEAAYHSLHAVTYPALRRQSAEQRARIARSPVEPVQSPVRLDKPEEHADRASSTLSGQRKLSELPERVVRGERRQLRPPVGLDKPEEHVNIVASDSLRRAEPVELQEPVVRDEKKRLPPFISITKPEEEWASPLSPRATYPGAIGAESEPSEAELLFSRKADLMPQSGFDPIPGREIFKPLTEPTVPQLAAERVSDAPTIQVTIGRVEIRATVESTPARKAPTKALAMSLDEYLRQRNGGRR